MKKIILVLVMALMVGVVAFAQEPVKYDYCEIVGTSRPMSNKITIVIDFGQKREYFADNRYKDETGKPVIFNSMVDALNFMGNQGWEFVQAYAVSYSNASIYYYLLKKKLAETKEPEKEPEIK